MIVRRDRTGARERRGRDWVAVELNISPRTVSRVLARHAVPHLCDLDSITGELFRASKKTIVRYERERPGELVHMDVNKPGKIPDGGAAEALTDQRAQEHDASLQVAGFYPSLHLNIADNLRRLGAFAAAAEQIGKAEERVAALPPGAYGDMIRTAIQGVGEAITARDTAPRPTSQTAGGTE